MVEYETRSAKRTQGEVPKSGVTSDRNLSIPPLGGLRTPCLVLDQVVMNCVRPTTASLFGDVPDLDCAKAAEIAKRQRKSGKSLRPSTRC